MMLLVYDTSLEQESYQLNSNKSSGRIAALDTVYLLSDLLLRYSLYCTCVIKLRYYRLYYKICIDSDTTEFSAVGGILSINPAQPAAGLRKLPLLLYV